MRLAAAIALTIVVAACGSEAVVDTTLPIQATVNDSPPTTTVTTVLTTTTSATSATTSSNQFDRVTLVGTCVSAPDEPASYQLTAQAFGQVESLGTGAITWNDSEIATLGVELDKNGEWTETIDVAEHGSGVFSVSSDGGAIIYSASLTVSPCDVAEPEPVYELILAAGAYCLEFYPYIEVLVDSEPFYEEDKPLVVFDLYCRRQRSSERRHLLASRRSAVTRHGRGIRRRIRIRSRRVRNVFQRRQRHRTGVFHRRRKHHLRHRHLRTR